MSDVILYSGNAFSVADGKGRFVLPLEMRKLVRQASGDENRLCLSVHMDNGCATGFGLSHKRFLFDEVAELERLAREANRPFNGDLERENRLGTIEDVNFDDGGRFFLHPDIKEEAGITAVTLGPVVWYGEDSIRGGAWGITFKEHFIVAHSVTEELSKDGWTEHEHQQILGMRWWSIQEIEEATDLTFPIGLSDLLRPILSGEYPEKLQIISTS